MSILKIENLLLFPIWSLLLEITELKMPLRPSQFYNSISQNIASRSLSHYTIFINNIISCRRRRFHLK